MRRKNIGYAALSVLYHQLEIDYLLNNRRRYTRFGANLNSIFKMLVFNRALYPDSKLGAWQGRGRGRLVVSGVTKKGPMPYRHGPQDTA